MTSSYRPAKGVGLEAMASRLPWLSVGSSLSDLESASSVSLLHSIYGSQVSQILLASDDSDVGLSRPVGGQEPVLSADRSRRPKSSPAVTRLERQQRWMPSSDVAFRARPATARVRSRQTSFVQGGGGRPKSALPVSKSAQSFTLLVPSSYAGPCAVLIVCGRVGG